MISIKEDKDILLASLAAFVLVLQLGIQISIKMKRDKNSEIVKPGSTGELKIAPRLQTWACKFLQEDTKAADLMWVHGESGFSSLCDVWEDRGMIAFGMGYAKGWWTTSPHFPTDDVLYEVSKRIYGNLRAFQDRIPILTGLKWMWQGRHRGVRPSLAVRDRAASDHYNLNSSVLWDSMLDPDTKTYTCGIFAGDSLDLGSAQLAKVDFYIDQAMGLKDMSEEARSNFSVLDIGAGWGSIANRLSQKYPTVKVSALTHSPVQAQEYLPNVTPIVSDMLEYDYPENTYDCITMIEIEHVGRDNYPVLMKKIRKALKPTGIYVMQSLNTPKTYAAFMDEFIDTYIFPGGYLPSVALLSAAAEKGGLKLISTQEWDTRHYEITFENWRRRFSANLQAIEDAIGLEAARAFRIYLAFTQYTFEAAGIAPHTMIFNKRGQPGSSVLFPRGVPQVPPIGITDEVLSEWLSSRRRLIGHQD